MNFTAGNLPKKMRYFSRNFRDFSPVRIKLANGKQSETKENKSTNIYKGVMGNGTAVVCVGNVDDENMYYGFFVEGKVFES